MFREGYVLLLAGVAGDEGIHTASHVSYRWINPSNDYLKFEGKAPIICTNNQLDDKIVEVLAGCRSLFSDRQIYTSYFGDITIVVKVILLM
jgi:hypothetical protein